MIMCFVGPLRHQSSGELHHAKLYTKLQDRTDQPAETTNAERQDS